MKEDESSHSQMDTPAFQRCPACGEMSLFWNPFTRAKECTNPKCKQSPIWKENRTEEGRAPREEYASAFGDSVKYCYKHHKYYKYECDTCRCEQMALRERQLGSQRNEPEMRQCPACSEKSLYWNHFVKLHECFNPACKRNFQKSEVGEIAVQQQRPPEVQLEQPRHFVRQIMKICPGCGQGTLYWNPNTSGYECLNSLCNMMVAPGRLRNVSAVRRNARYLILIFACLALIGYATFQFSGLGYAAIGLILVASIAAIWSAAAMIGLLKFGNLRIRYATIAFPFIIILLVLVSVFWVSESSHSKVQAKENELVTVQGKLSTTTADLNNTKSEISGLNSQITSLQNTVNQLQTQLKLYQDTGITVYSGIQPAVTDAAGVSVTLTRNSAAQNPTWAQLESFILADKTDSNPYIMPTYTCADFARDVYDHAEAAGIRTAFVFVTFQGQTIGHALDAFVTTDEGLKYIDCTGIPPGQAGPSNNDTTVSVKPGTEYTPQFILPTDWTVLPLGIVSTVEIYW